MELQLHTVEHDFYERVDLQPVSSETMRENIVPDSCADIARIVETTGEVYLTGRDMMADGRFSATGTVDVSILYIPEKGVGPCVLRYQLPFHCSGEGHEGELEHFDVHAELRSVDTRVLNPRKVLTRVDLLLYPSGCRKRKLKLCSGQEQEEKGLQMLHRTCKTKTIAAVREKEFSFSEDLIPAAGRNRAAEILRSTLFIRCGDSKIIGNKVVVKGMLSAHILYREESGEVTSLQQDVPFSQIMEGSGLQEQWECVSRGQLLGTECTIGGGKGNGEGASMLTISVQMRIRTLVWKEEEMELMADLYSTSEPVKTCMEEICLQQINPRQSRRMTGREMLETGVAVKRVVDACVSCAVGCPEGGSDHLDIPVTARCLYTDENDMLHSVERTFRLPCPAETGENVHLRGWGECRGDVMAAIFPEGIELRFPVDCTLEGWQSVRYLCVAGVEAEEQGADRGEEPSLILRKLDTRESLWSVAKQYRTTCRAILAVNEIESEAQIPRDRLLLIPRVRG